MRIQLSDHFSYRRLLRFTLPSIVMMIFTSIYYIVDGFFVSNYAGKTPFAAVNLIMPVFMIVATVGFMFGTGGSAIVAKEIGKGNRDKANQYFSLFVYLSFVLGTLFAALGIIFMPSIALLLGAQGQLLENCVVYGRTILIALPFYVIQLLFQSFFVTAEKPKIGLSVTVIAGVTNMILDALLVILLPLEYKLMGAGIATVTSQVIGGLISLVYFFRKNNSLLRLGKTNFNGKIILKACSNGSSEFMNNVSMNIVGILYNAQLVKFAGENGVAAYGVMMYISLLFSGAFIGYSIGTAPIISYHYGANQINEVKSVLKKSLRIILVFSLIIMGMAELLAQPLSYIFVGYDAELMSFTLSGFRIFAISFLMMGFSIFVSAFFTALNDGLTSALISFLRTLVFQIAAVLLLPLIWGINGIWISIVVAEFMAILITMLFLVVKRKKYQY